MRLKPAILFVQNANLILILGLLAGVFALVSRSGDGKILVFEVLIAIPFLLAFFFRMVIINIYLKKCKYPVPFLAVLDKLGLAKDFDINWSADAEKDVVKPTYSTETFLTDNHLITEIGAKKLKPPSFHISIGAALVAFFFLGRTYTMQQKPILFGSILFFLVVNIIGGLKGKTKQNDSSSTVRFTDKGLFVNDEFFDWKDIYDWNYTVRGKTSPNQMIINYYGQDRNIQEAAINIDEINTDKIDLLLLLTHFKAKYG